MAGTTIGLSNVANTRTLNATESQHFSETGHNATNLADFSQIDLDLSLMTGYDWGDIFPPMDPNVLNAQLYSLSETQ